ncbi:unnamed protein product [Brassica oleracea]
MRRVSTSPKKSTYRKTDFCHVKGLANAIWASNFTGPTSFKFEKPVKPISRLSSLSPFREMKSKGVAAVSSSPIKLIGKTGASSSLNIGVRGKASVSSSAKGKAIISDNVGDTKVLIDLEMLLIDEEETVIQSFIPHGRIETYLRHMKAGATYRLNKFYGSKSKTIYRDWFRIHGYKEFEAACDLRGDLYAEIAASRRVELHVQTHDDLVLKLYLWDKVAFEFCEKFKASGGTARVILVTTINPKRFVGVLSLSSMTPSRVFLDSDVQETRLYLSWLNSKLDVANRVNAKVVTKPETATLGKLFSYMKQAPAKVAWFECTKTIDDVVHGSGWYYIGCGVCHTKATKGPTTLLCKKCGKSEIVGVAQYLSKLSVYDHNDQAVFVVLGDAGEELTGKKAAELVESYYQANDSVGEDHIVPVPQAMIDTIGQTRKFIVKVLNHNLTAKSQTLTVTKVLPLEAPEPEGNLGENVDEEPDNEREDHADESVKRGDDGIESEGAKRTKSG